MNAGREFDEWARDGRDQGMEDRHWHTATHALARMPVETGEVVLDLGCGSGYAGRALCETKGAARSYGLDAAPEMARNAREYTEDLRSGYLNGERQVLEVAVEIPRAQVLGVLAGVARHLGGGV